MHASVLCMKNQYHQAHTACRSTTTQTHRHTHTHVHTHTQTHLARHSAISRLHTRAQRMPPANMLGIHEREIQHHYTIIIPLIFHTCMCTHTHELLHHFPFYALQRQKTICLQNISACTVMKRKRRGGNINPWDLKQDQSRAINA